MNTGVFELRRYNNEFVAYGAAKYTIEEKFYGKEELIEFLQTPPRKEGDTEFIIYEWVFIPNSVQNHWMMF